MVVTQGHRLDLQHRQRGRCLLLRHCQDENLYYQRQELIGSGIVVKL